MNAWRQTVLVAAREATERARSRAYIASTVLTVVILAVVMGVSVLTAPGTPRYEFGVVGPERPEVSRALQDAASAAGAEVTVVAFPDAAAGSEAVTTGTVDGVVLDDRTLLVRTRGSAAETVAVAALTRHLLETALEERGIDLNELAAATAITVDATEPPVSDGDQAVAMVAVVLLFLVITTYGQWVVLGVLEEKTTRVVEQVVSAVGVRSLLAGKVIGIGVLGLGQLLIMVAAGVGAGMAFEVFSLPQSTASTVAWSLVWFMLGFAFYAVLYAAAASLVSRSEDAQTAAMPVALVGVAAYLTTFGMISASQPDSTLFRIISLLPPVAPIAFPARIAAGEVPWWEVLLGVAITTAAVVGVVRVAARIYSGALLAQGGRIGWRRAWRQSRELTGR